VSRNDSDSFHDDDLSGIAEAVLTAMIAIQFEEPSSRSLKVLSGVMVGDVTIFAACKLAKGQKRVRMKKRAW
jgi:hypothetical protein